MMNLERKLQRIVDLAQQATARQGLEPRPNCPKCSDRAFVLRQEPTGLCYATACSCDLGRGTLNGDRKHETEKQTHARNRDKLVLARKRLEALTKFLDPP
jgi:hypothetical protein